MSRRYLGIPVLGAVSLFAIGGTGPGRQILGTGAGFVRAYEEVQQSGVKVNFMERVALSVIVAGATHPACHMDKPQQATSSF